MKKYWLMKSEPTVYSWHMLVTEKDTSWDGVRNHQANNYLKLMRTGDEAFFYHSGKERSIVGTMKIVAPWRADASDETGRFGMVNVAAIAPFAHPVALSALKADAKLASMVLLRLTRLSVTPVSTAEWEEICHRARSN